MMIAADDDLLDIARHGRRGQSLSMLFTAAVRYLALELGHSGLDDLFRGRVRVDELDHLYPEYRSFVLDHAREIRSIIALKVVNKNEIRRSACLRALLIAVCRAMEWQRVQIVEIGCSVGLNLLLDKFSFVYRAIAAGPSPAGPLTIPIGVVSGQPPEAPMPEIVSRTGIDLEFVDPVNPSDRNWILSQILPEDSGDLAIMDNALSMLAEESPSIHIGDASTLVGQLARDLPGDVPVVFMHSMALHQFDLSQKRQFTMALRQISQHRTCGRISMELAGDACQLRSSAPRADLPGVILGTADMDAHWMTWQ